jgi:hypothetical protein
VEGDDDGATLDTHVKPRLRLFFTDYLFNAFKSLFGDNIGNAVVEDEEVD